jgi:hypothetical protein
VKGEIFQSKLGNKENADDAARALCHRSRGATTQPIYCESVEELR